jgi:hypothetical protein
MTPATEEKRKQFLRFIEQVLAPETAVIGVVGIGSIATGHMRPDSDIDAVIFLDPFDYYIVPAEAIWHPATDTFFSIFSSNETIHKEGVQVDFLRINYQQWAKDDFVWPEGYKAEISAGWLAHDKDGKTASLIAQKTAYNDEERIRRLDEAIIWLDQHLSGNPQKMWESLGPAIALDRLEAAYCYLVQALFALNRRWQPWRNREMQHLLALPWLPDNFGERVVTAANAPSLDFAGFEERAKALKDLFNDVLSRLIDQGDYSPTPVDQAFIRSHEEPGRAWNMEEWNKFRQVRKLTLNE